MMRSPLMIAVILVPTLAMAGCCERGGTPGICRKSAADSVGAASVWK